MPNLPDRPPHLHRFHRDMCELERCPDSGPESPHVALRRILRHHRGVRIENPMVSVKYYCGPMSPSKGMDAELRAPVPRLECVGASLITQVVVPRRVRETMISVRYRSFGEATLTRIWFLIPSLRVLAEWFRRPC